MTIWDPMEYLNKLHTRQLMALLNRCRACHGYYDVTDNNNPDFIVTTDQVKEVLATREHIPNKKEGKEIRRQKAKQKV